MKSFKIFSFLFLLITSACSSGDDDDNATSSQLDGLELTQTISSDAHVVELYTTSGRLHVGYNKVWLRITESSSNNVLEPVNISWLPLMHMMSMQHAGPASQITTSEEKGVYEGYLIFQMAGNDSEYWELQFDYKLNGNDYTASEEIDVLPTSKINTHTFMGEDGEKYVLSLMEPQKPKTGINEMQVALFRMDDAMHFSAVDDFRVKIDPRMPAMNNHGSPNNTDLLQLGDSDIYFGKLSLTMTGYWFINLQILNSEGDIIKGEEVTDEVDASSLYFEIEF